MFVRGAPARGGDAKRFPEVRRVQAVVTREAHHDHLQIVAEVDGPAPRRGSPRASRRRSASSSRCAREVRLAPAGTIPEGAKRIDDRRVWK